jgi:hypothetical protein
MFGWDFREHPKHGFLKIGFFQRELRQYTNNANAALKLAHL